MKRIKHNDLTHYFIRDHKDLPPAYLASCEKFFKELTQKRIRENMGLEPGEVDDGASTKRQASSTKQQAPAGLNSDTIKIYK
jgi:hypothetical protein